MNVLHKSFYWDRYESSYQVHEPQNNMRLDQFIQIMMGPGLSREMIKKKIKSGDIYISQRSGKLKPHTRVKKREIIHLVIRKTTHEDEYWNGEKLSLQEPEILHQDKNLFVISKPPYMSTHPTGRHLFYCATVYLEKVNQNPVYSLHRLDRETSGVLLLARNLETAKNITPLFEWEKIKKTYFFIGVKNRSYKNLKEFYAHERLESQTNDSQKNRIYSKAYPTHSPYGKKACTYFQILKELKGDDELSYLLGLAFPQSGRQHQIRLHAQYHGLPLLGDKLYYGPYGLFQRFKDLKANQKDYQLMQIPRHALHALAINLPYPDPKNLEKRQTFFSPIPQDLKTWMKKKFKNQLDQLQGLEESLKERIESYW